MKNLYIYTFKVKSSGKTELKRTVWEDICNTRDGRIVKKAQKKYNLDYGVYKYIKEINQYTPSGAYGDEFTKEVCYFSYEDDVNLNSLVEVFIQDRQKQIKRLTDEINTINIVISPEFNR